MRRHMEDFVTWVDTSKLKRTIMTYNDEVRAGRSPSFVVSSDAGGCLFVLCVQLDDFDLL